jgi:anti-sigma-K factor RskA
MKQQDQKPELVELAGEYVLGTLAENERRDFERALAHDRQLQAEVSAWEQRLGPMLDAVEPETPPAGIWQAIEQRIEPPAEEQKPGFWDSLSFWRNLGMVTAGLLVVFSLVLFQVPPGGSNGMDQVMMVSNDQSQTGWYVSTKQRSGALQVKAVAPTQLSKDQHCQLWMEKEDGRMMPVGVMPHEGSQEFAMPEGLTENSRFKVSIEQKTDAPTTKPRGEVIFDGSMVTLY